MYDPEKLIEDLKDQPLTIIQWIQNVKQFSSEKALKLRICNEFPLRSGIVVDYSRLAQIKLVHLQE